MDEEGLNTLVFIAEGDMRNAVNNLQAVYVARKDITKQNIFEICDVPDTDQIKNIYLSIKEKNIENTLQNFQILWNMDYSTHDLIRYLVKFVEVTEIFDYDEKMILLKHGCDLRYMDAKGLGNKTQILGALSRMLIDMQRVA